MLIIFLICISTLVSTRPTQPHNLRSDSRSNRSVSSDPFLPRTLAPAQGSDTSPKLHPTATDPPGADHPLQNSTYPDIPIFNPIYSVCFQSLLHPIPYSSYTQQKEIQKVTAKYIHAKKTLSGQGLSPLPNFTYLASSLGNNDPTAVHIQVFFCILSTNMVSLGSLASRWFDVRIESSNLWGGPCLLRASKPGLASPVPLVRRGHRLCRPLGAFQLSTL